MCKLHRICHSLQWWYDYCPQTDHTAQAPSDRLAKKWHVWKKLDSICFLIISPQKNWVHKCEATTWFSQSASCKVNFWVDVTWWRVMMSVWGWELPRSQEQWHRAKLLDLETEIIGLAVWLKRSHSNPVNLSVPIHRMVIIRPPQYLQVIKEHYFLKLFKFITLVGNSTHIASFNFYNHR